MITPRVVHTVELAGAEREQIRALLDVAFDGRFDDHDWSHTLGGLHVVVTAADRVVAHAAVVQRQLVHADRPVRTGYVEGVAVDPQFRGLGYAAAVMDRVEGIVQAAYELGALSAADRVARMYLARGWLAWQGPTFVLAPEGRRRTPDDDDSTYVLPVPGSVPVDLTGELTCDWRGGDVW